MPTTPVDVSSQDYLREIATAIDKAKRIVVVIGAGISTNAGIPDFRSINGLYSSIQVQHETTFKPSGAPHDHAIGDPSDPKCPRRPKGKDMFHTTTLGLHTEAFYRFQTALRKASKAVEPTDTHRFLVVLRDRKKLVRCYSQNIDMLEEKVGLSTDLEPGTCCRTRPITPKAPGGRRGLCGEERAASESNQSRRATIHTGEAPRDQGGECVLLHGSLSELRCLQCNKTASWDDESREAETESGRQPLCPHCTGFTETRREQGKRATSVGVLRPDIVLYGEQHPREDLLAQLIKADQKAQPDMLLIMGTSLRVPGVRLLVKDFAKIVRKGKGYVVFVNRTAPAPSEWGDVIDYWVSLDCDAWVGNLRQREPVLWQTKTTSQLGGHRSKRKRRKAASFGAPAHVGAKHARLDAAEAKDGTKPNSTPKVVLGSPTAIPGAKQTILATTGNLARGTTDHDMTSTGQRAGRRNRYVFKEMKLNPPPTRPQAVRDHKMNGAYLVWKIRQDLARIVKDQIGLELIPNDGKAPPILHTRECQRQTSTATQSIEPPGHRLRLQAPNSPPHAPVFAAHRTIGPGDYFMAVTDEPRITLGRNVNLSLAPRDLQTLVVSDMRRGLSQRPPVFDAGHGLASLLNQPAATSKSYPERSIDDRFQMETHDAARTLFALRVSR